VSLRERLSAGASGGNQATGPNPKGQASSKALVNPAVSSANANRSEGYEEIKGLLHAKLIENLNLSSLEAVGEKEIKTAGSQLLQLVLMELGRPITHAEREQMLQELVEEILGLGPLEPLLKDPSVADILVNGPNHVFVERNGKLQRANVRFKDNAHLMHIVDRIVSGVGRRVDEKNPMVDARLQDGSRFNAIIPPLALDGPSLSIRKFRQDSGSMDKLLAWGSLNSAMAQVLEAAVQAHLNIIISGGTGAGKTTLLNSLSSLIAHDERIVTIEDSAELQLQQDHVVRLETRPPNVEGEGEITARHLLVNSLRMRPDRIIIGECRSGEALDMLQAMNTGHDGSLTTLHANTPRDALGRIETMCMMNDHPLPEKTIRQQTASAIHLIVQASRLSDGSRRITSITEVTGMEGNMIALQELFKYEQRGVDEEGKIIGDHVACGVRPKFLDKLKVFNVNLPQTLFLGPDEAQRLSPEELARFEASLPQEALKGAGNSPSTSGPASSSLLGSGGLASAAKATGTARSTTARSTPQSVQQGGQHSARTQLAPSSAENSEDWLRQRLMKGSTP
jgi:pilus assembly protein CpaF